MSLLISSRSFIWDWEIWTRLSNGLKRRMRSDRASLPSSRSSRCWTRCEAILDSRLWLRRSDLFHKEISHREHRARREKPMTSYPLCALCVLCGWFFFLNGACSDLESRSQREVGQCSFVRCAELDAERHTLVQAI